MPKTWWRQISVDLASDFTDAGHGVRIRDLSTLIWVRIVAMRGRGIWRGWLGSGWRRGLGVGALGWVWSFRYRANCRLPRQSLQGLDQRSDHPSQRRHHLKGTADTFVRAGSPSGSACRMRISLRRADLAASRIDLNGYVRAAGCGHRCATAFDRLGQSAGCQRRNVAPWSSTHSVDSPNGLRPGSSARPPAARTRSTAAAMSSTR
jgi:hypothetical protein